MEPARQFLLFLHLAFDNWVWGFRSQQQPAPEVCDKCEEQDYLLDGNAQSGPRYERLEVHRGTIHN